MHPAHVDNLDKVVLSIDLQHFLRPFTGLRRFHYILSFQEVFLALSSHTQSCLSYQHGLPVFSLIGCSRQPYSLRMFQPINSHEMGKVAKW